MKTEKTVETEKTADVFERLLTESMSKRNETPLGTPKSEKFYLFGIEWNMKLDTKNDCCVFELTDQVTLENENKYFYYGSESKNYTGNIGDKDYEVDWECHTFDDCQDYLEGDQKYYTICTPVITIYYDTILAYTGVKATLQIILDKFGKEIPTKD